MKPIKVPTTAANIDEDPLQADICPRAITVMDIYMIGTKLYVEFKYKDWIVAKHGKLSARQAFVEELSNYLNNRIGSDVSGEIQFSKEHCYDVFTVFPTTEQFAAAWHHKDSPTVSLEIE